MAQSNFISHDYGTDRSDQSRTLTAQLEGDAQSEIRLMGWRLITPFSDSAKSTSWILDRTARYWQEVRGRNWGSTLRSERLESEPLVVDKRDPGLQRIKLRRSVHRFDVAFPPR